MATGIFFGIFILLAAAALVFNYNLKDYDDKHD